MFKKILLSVLLMTGFGSAVMAEPGKIADVDFSFEGPFGRYDDFQLQRGLQVFTESCASCHGLQYLAYRNLADEGGLGWTEDQMKAYTGQFEVFDAEKDEFRTAVPTDHFPTSQIDGAPDLTLMAKARAGFSGPYGLGINQVIKGMGGPEYIVAILTGFVEPPECAPEDFDGTYNSAFAPGGYPESCVDEEGHRMTGGSWMGMPPPLFEEGIDFADGSPNDIHSQSVDVAAFLMWTAEPKLTDRKKAGVVWVAFLILLTVLLYLTNKKIWAKVKRKD